MMKRMVLAGLFALAAVPALAADTAADRRVVTTTYLAAAPGGAIIGDWADRQIASRSKAETKAETVVRACTCKHGS